MRTLVDISSEAITQLDFFAKQAHVSRAFLIRKAIEEFLSHQKKMEKNVFGLLKDENFLEALEFQNRIRNEWV